MKASLVLWPFADLNLEASGGLEKQAFETFKLLNINGFEAKLFARKIIGYKLGIESLSPFFGINTIYYLKFIIRNLNADVLLSFNAPKIALFFPQKTIITFGNELILPHYSHRKVQERYKRTNFIFVSKFLLNEFIKTHPSISKNKCQLIYPGVDLQKFTPSIESTSGDCKKILFGSQWVYEKGIFTLLKAAKILENRKKDFKILLAGGAHLWSGLGLDERNKLELKVLDISKKMENIEILGTVPYVNMPSLFSSSDIFVFPSEWEEPLGLASIEAMACGLPVVGSDVGGVSEVIVNGKTGLLVKPSKPGELADALEYILDNELVAKDMGKKGRERVEKMFSIDTYIKEYISKIKEVADNDVNFPKLIKNRYNQ
jgi:glycosyltransferase involved in cell wall biosynthesis